ncbi:uncharacterized protein LOC6529857 [Drosophila yakuba]|uniref:Seminal fluid protein n=1 Tax=Drosophila yakuba TaxID=7245 RepID=B4P423_DROYA|nr:uncharacterized protein LOC6529857 [Drosophila yakuba]EDW90533.1 uncharacterized protein Dyak_GE13314 [Drosophila yakuba]
MKIITFLVLANLHFALSTKEYEEADRMVTWRLQNIVKKYKNLATGNAEFSQWIEKINNIAVRSDFRVKMEMEGEFNVYDQMRQSYEDKITERLTTIRSLIAQRKGGNRCVKFYQHQQNELKNAYKSSNKRKSQVVTENSRDCPTRKREKRMYDYYNDYDNYGF